MSDAAELALMQEARERAAALAAEAPPTGPGPGSAERALIEARRSLHERQISLGDLRAGLTGGGAAASERLAERRPLPRPVVPVAIVVPVHDALDELRACFHALVRNTTAPARILFIDDMSNDPEVVRSLLGWREFTGVELLRNDENQGFSATVNRGLRATPGYDVVVLNSDTAVTPHWLERLISSAYGDPLIATVTPLSDNAGAFSVPRIGQSNPTPPFLDDDQTSRAIAHHSETLRPSTPTANGFCMYIKRAAIDAVGHFDATAFPRGYGEENDFCLRAIAAGWRHVVDDRVFIHHVREASFGADKRALMEAGRAKVDALHPQYSALVREFVDGDMARVRTNVAGAYRDVQESYDRAPHPSHEVRPRVLFVTHEGRGGTPATNLDLMLDLGSEYECWLLTSTRTELRLASIADGELQDVDTWTLETPLSAMDFSRSDYRAVVTEILDRRAIELIHIRHLFKHTLDLPSVAAARGIPVVFSFHDFYFVCPTVHLVDDKLRYCGGLCSPGPGECEVPFDEPAPGRPVLKHRFVYSWRAEVEQALAGVDAFVTTSSHAWDVHLRALPSLERRRFTVIEHGRDLAPTVGVTAPHPGGPVRIVVAGNLDRHKGADLMRSILAHDASGRIRFHLLGDVPERYANLGQVHGRYERDEFAERLADVHPAFVGIFSIWAETYSHIMSEAWAAGVPVLATRLGALGERIERHGGGWLIDHEDPGQAVETILAIADDPDTYERGRARATVGNLRSVAAMSADYSALYREVIDGRRTFTPRRARAGTRHLRHGVLRAEVVLPGQDGDYPGSSHVRLLRRLTHPSVRAKLQATLQHGGDWSAIPADRDLVIVQRTAIAPDRLEAFLAAVARRGLPLVLDLDDDLFALGGDDEEYGQHLAGLERLLSAASLVTVSTPVLQRLLARRAVPTLLLENLIDERLFFAGPRRATRRPHPGEPQVVYVSGPRHERDLALLEPVFERLREAGTPARLSVVGRFAPGRRSDQPDWYHPVPVPAGHGGYPQFIRWLGPHAGGWDLAVAPLAATDFNRSKSDLKFIEYAALGLPGVFSNLEPYTSVEHRVTGLVVDNDVGAWQEAISELAADHRLRAALAARALGYVRSTRLLRHGSDRLLSALFDLVSGRGPAT